MSAFLLLSVPGAAGQIPPDLQKNLPASFREIKKATKKYAGLWGRDLYGAMLLIDPQTRRIFANEPDATHVLTRCGDIYTGILPDSVNFANTSMDWNGKRWAMIMLPLPPGKHDRLSLLAHELFHTVQPSLGFVLRDADNRHLDQKHGRVYLRLELEALKKAVRSLSKKEQRRHLSHAMVFRKYRHSLYEGSPTAENLLELNEGLAEFTGAVVSGRSGRQAGEHLAHSMDAFISRPTFVRSFAYYTVPAYGYLLYKENKNWNREITAETGLTDYFIRAFAIQIPPDLKETADSLSGDYGGAAILQEETEREEKNRALVDGYKRLLVEQPHFEIRFEQMSISFDPGNIVPLGDEGSVYPTLRVSDRWGVLTVRKGALVSARWDKVSITNPVRTEGRRVEGDGWLLELTEGYVPEKDAEGGYHLSYRGGGGDS
ncbi:MAG: hypothetical protein LBP25_01890 [Tannerellaceae bacterium]|jgi:hypothetical protein|nr:hypothetical protein [Tannerellaceae bacterium]